MKEIQLLKSKAACCDAYLEHHSGLLAMIVGIQLFLAERKKSKFELVRYEYPTYSAVKTKYGKRQELGAFGKEKDADWLYRVA